MCSVKGLRRFIKTLNLVCLEASKIEVIFLKCKNITIKTIKLENIGEVIFSRHIKECVL